MHLYCIGYYTQSSSQTTARTHAAQPPRAPPGRGRHAPRFRVHKDHDQATAPSHHSLEGHVPLEEEEAIEAAAAAAAADGGSGGGYGPARPLLQPAGGSFGTVTTAGGSQQPSLQQAVVTGQMPPPQSDRPQRITHSGSLDAAVAALAFGEDRRQSRMSDAAPQEPICEAVLLRASQVAAGRRLDRAESDSFKRFLDRAIGSDAGSPPAPVPEDDAELLAWLEQGGGADDHAAAAGIQ